MRRDRFVVASTVVAIAASLWVAGAKIFAAPGGNSASSVSPVEVVDSGGRSLGVLLDLDIVVRTVGTTRFSFNVLTDSIPTTGGSLAYTSNDCSGQAYIGVSAVPRQGFTTGPSTGANTVFYGGNPVQSISVNSFRRVAPDGTLDVCQASSGVFRAGTAMSSSLASFVPPFDGR